MGTKTKNSDFYLLVMLGTVSAFGPFVTDFYLPALPSLSEYFKTAPAMAQLSLTSSMAGLAAGQLVTGPLSDRYGRKRPLLLSLMVFCAATLGCLSATSVCQFVFFRLLQGLAGAGGVVISKSVVTDLYSGVRLVRFFSLLSSVQGIVPVFAPVLGGLLLTVTDWKGIFWIQFAVAVVLVAFLTRFRESLRGGSGRGSGVRAGSCRYAQLLSDRRFMCCVSLQAVVMGSVFAYIAASPFLFQNHFGMSPVAYSMCFGANAVAVMLGSLAVPLFRDALRSMRAGAGVFVAMSMAVGVVFIVGSPVWLVELALFLFLFSAGMILPGSTVMALGAAPVDSGKASALLGFLTFMAGGILSPLTGLGDMLFATALIVIGCEAAVLVMMANLRKEDGKEAVDLV